LCSYLLFTKDEGIIYYDPTRDKSIEVYADADFFGNWNKATAAQDISTAKSRTGYLIKKFSSCMPYCVDLKVANSDCLELQHLMLGISLCRSPWEMPFP
jgi:hypothetical protein